MNKEPISVIENPYDNTVNIDIDMPVERAEEVPVKRDLRAKGGLAVNAACLLYTSPSPRD